MPPIITQILKGCLALVLLAILGTVAFSYRLRVQEVPRARDEPLEI